MKQEIIEGGELIGVVYQIRNLVNGKIYIGSSANFNRRKKRHIEDLKSGVHHNKILQRAFSKYGLASFVIEIIEQFQAEGKKDILKREQVYLDTLKPSYNICLVAGSQLGAKRNDEFKKKCSERMKGKPTWNKGLKLPPQSDATKHKRSKSLTGKTRSDEIKKRMSEKKKGVLLSEKHRQALSEAKLKGTTNDKKIIGITEDGLHTEYRSISKAVRLNKIGVQTIYDSLNNVKRKWKRKQTLKTKWMWKPVTA